MSIIDKINNLSDTDMVDLCDNYYSASDVLKRYFKCSSNGNYASIINNKAKELSLQWRKRGVIEKACPVCNKNFITIKSINSTTCSYSCSNTYFRSGENNPNFKHDAGANYRQRALNYYGSKCNKCGITEERVLIVHHIDRDRKNNSIENLEVLCANCHMLEHYI